MSSPWSVRGVLRRRPPATMTPRRAAVDVDGAVCALLDEQVRELPERESGVLVGAPIGGHRQQGVGGAAEAQPRLAGGREVLVELMGGGGEPLGIRNARDRAVPVAHEQRAGLEQTAVGPVRQPPARVDLEPSVRRRQRRAACMPRVHEGPVRLCPPVDPQLAQRLLLGLDRVAAGHGIVDALALAPLLERHRRRQAHHTHPRGRQGKCRHMNGRRAPVRQSHAPALAALPHASRSPPPRRSDKRARAAVFHGAASGD